MLSKVSATVRTVRGKNAARRLRADGMIPAVAYGQGEDVVSLAVSPEEVKGALLSERGVNVVLDLEIDGKKSGQAMIADYQYHPLSRSLLHADFIRVTDQTQVTVDVPLELTGRPRGVVMGGSLRQVFRVLSVRCTPNLIPVKITHDVSSLELDTHVAISDLSVPDGVEILLPAKRTVATVAVDRHAKKEEEAEEKEKEKK